MAEIWPEALNYVLDRGSFSIEEQDVARSDFDDGPALVRTRFTNTTTMYNGTITLTDSEFNLFRGFYKNALASGSRWFSIPLWEGTDYSVHKVRFKEPYQIRDEGWNQYTLGIKLEVRDYATYSIFASYLIGLYGVDFVINEMADPLQIIINIDYPQVMMNY